MNSVECGIHELNYGIPKQRVYIPPAMLSSRPFSHRTQGIYFSEGGTVSVGRDRVDTSLALLELANLIEQRVKILPVGFKDYVVMERLMDNPMMLALLPRTIPPKQVYDSVESYIRRRDCVPESWDILLVDPRTAAEVGSHLRVEGVQATVHVVGVKAPLWTYHSQAELENAIMVEMFTQARICSMDIVH